MRATTVYLDTSIISFLHADDEPRLRGITEEFFESYLDLYQVSISRIVLMEIDRTTDPNLRQRLHDSVAKYSLPVIELTDDESEEAFLLAEAYLAEGIIPPAKKDDAMHLAIATVRGYDVLLSWNFKHLANIRKQAQVVALNAVKGHLRPLSLLSPLEVMYEK